MNDLDSIYLKFFQFILYTSARWIIKKKRFCPCLVQSSISPIGSQETPEETSRFGLGVQYEAGQRLIDFLPRECTGHSKHPLPTTQEKTLHMDITRWSTLKSD